MSLKKRVGILFGGRSAEHEISVISARSIVQAINRDKYEVVLLGIDNKGLWFQCEEQQLLGKGVSPPKIKFEQNNEQLAITPGRPGTEIVSWTQHEAFQPIDVIFPVLHGTYGEDGSVQGLLKLSNIPFVGASVLGSAVGMDKDISKRLLQQSAIPVAKFAVFRKNNIPKNSFKHILATLGMPVFIKPANLGSSVGVSKVESEKEFEGALKTAFQYDHKIIIEEAIEGREIECAVLGNEKPKASLPGEIVPRHSFYSYEAKYLDENGAQLIIPANLDQSTTKKVQKLAVRTFETLCCEGMARVDFFIDKADTIIVNEINTIPGFTSISMYPKLWEASGISYPELIDILIELAIERHSRDQNLKTDFEKNY